MADNEVLHWICVAVRLLGVPTENVVNCPSVVKSRWCLTVAVEIGIPARVRQPLDLVSFRWRNYSEVRVAISPTFLNVQAGAFKSRFKPVLEVELLVGTANAPNQFSLTNRFYAVSKDNKGCHDSFFPESIFTLPDRSLSVSLDERDGGQSKSARCSTFHVKK